MDLSDPSIPEAKRVFCIIFFCQKLTNVCLFIYPVFFGTPLHFLGTPLYSSVSFQIGFQNIYETSHKNLTNTKQTPMSLWHLSHLALPIQIDEVLKLKRVIQIPHIWNLILQKRSYLKWVCLCLERNFFVTPHNV